MTKFIVFGDTGGHFTQLFLSLLEIGLDPDTGVLPDDVEIVHCGDLIHKGPDSNFLIMFVDQMMQVNPGRWHQILGNHEFNYIQGAPTFWSHQPLSSEAWKTLQKWFHKKLAQPAFAIPGPVNIQVPKKLLKLGFDADRVFSKGVLFTHAGLSRNFWRMIGEPADAEHAARTINGLSVSQVTKFGEMLSSYQPRSNPGPVWASGVREVFNTWRYEDGDQAYNVEQPFINVHGHTTAYSWVHNVWYKTSSLLFRNASALDVNRRVSFTMVADSLQIGIDPGFSTSADLEKQPYLVVERA